MEELDFPTPRYSIGDRVIFNPKDHSQYSATELRYVGKLGLVMPTSKDTIDATTIPMIKFDKSERKYAIAQDDLILHDVKFVPHKQPEQGDQEIELCPADKHKMYEKNIYWPSFGDAECRQCRLDANWERMIMSRNLVGA